MSASHPRTWRRFAGFTLPGAPGDDRLAMEKVAAVVQELHLAEVLLARLKTVVAEAVLNRVEHSLRRQAEAPVLIEVCVYTSTTRLADVQSPSGWGFFLIERMAEPMNISRAASHYVIDLYLYEEGEAASPG